MYQNLNMLSPPTVRVLISTRILFSGLLFQQFFHKQLTTKQWLALCLLVVGCTAEQLGSFNMQGGIVY